MLICMMNTSQPEVPGLLVIGYGSPLRGDDSAGFQLAVELDRENPEGIRCMAVHQLTPELAEAIAGANEVFFVDVYAANAFSRDLCVMELTVESDHPSSISSHGQSPSTLLKLSAQLYDAHPKAWIVAIPAFEFSLGEHLSNMTRTCMKDAHQFILDHLSQTREVRHA